MKKQMHENIIEFLLDFLQQERDSEIKVREISEKVIVWTVGLSAGSIALLIYNYKNMLGLDSNIIKLSILFFVVSIISGVIFRSAQPSIEKLSSLRLSRFIGYCESDKMKFNFPRQIIESDTIENIAKYLKEDMGFDYDQWLEYEYLDRDFWVNHYKSWIEFWKKQEDEGMEKLMKEISIFSGSKLDEVKDTFSGNAPESKTKNISSYIYSYSYYLTNIFFGLGVLIISLGFVFG